MPAKNDIQDSLEVLVASFVKSDAAFPSTSLVHQILERIKVDGDGLFSKKKYFLFEEDITAEDLVEKFLEKAKKDYQNSHILGVGHSFGKKILVAMRMVGEVIVVPIAAVTGVTGMFFEKIGNLLLGGDPDKSWSVFNAPAKIMSAIGWSIRCSFLKNQNQTGLAENIFNKYRPIGACVDKLISLNPSIMNEKNSPQAQPIAENLQYTHTPERTISFVDMVTEQRKKSSSRNHE
jgi:hypothetical protein